MNRFRRLLPLSLLVLGVALTVDSTSSAQKKGPGGGNAQAPRLALTAPLGMQRGTALDLVLTGANLSRPTSVWTEIPGAKVTIPTDANNGKEPGKLRVRLEVPNDAPLGFHALRLGTAHGVSNLQLFCVDDLPQVASTEKNRSAATAQGISPPCVVIGRVAPESADYYKFTVAAGQRVSFDVLAHRLGSPLDPQITLIDFRRQRELPGGHNNDAPGLQTDCRLSYQFAEAGEYVVEIRDTTYRGGAEFWYRLRVGDFPCATSPLPMAAKRGTKATVFFGGPHVDNVWPEVVDVPADPAAEAVWVAPRGASGLHGWPVALALSDHDELLEHEPNDDAAHANRIPVPSGITAAFQAKGDTDFFTFEARKGQRFVIEAHSQEFYSPCEVYLALKDAKGAELAKTNPTAPPRLNFTAPADGDYVLAVEHLFNWNGPTENYRITVTAQEPDFELAVASDRLDVPQGGSALVNVTAVRRDYNGPIEVSLEGVPGVHGQATLPAGQTAVAFLAHATPDAALNPRIATVRGQATINGKSVTRTASARAALSADLAGLTYPPLQFNDQVAIAVTEKAPFAMTVHAKQTECYPGGPFPLLVSVARGPGFTEEVSLAVVNLPPTVTPALKNIAKGKSDGEMQLNATPKVALGSSVLYLAAKGKYQNSEYTALAPFPFAVALPFELKAEPAALKLKPGDKAKLKVHAVRKGGYQGPIAIELKNLPAQVASPKATIAEKQDDVEIELTAAPEAPAADKNDVTAAGVATAAANQAAASPPFAVGVLKK